TPQAIDLQRTFRRMLDAGDSACAMEVSSHALELRRTDGIRFACRVFTNLTQDHLDFHPSMEAYFRAKRTLFGGPGASVVNVDDDYGVRLVDELPDAVTYAIHAEADYRAVDVEFDPAGAAFTCATPDGESARTTRPPGLVKVSPAPAPTATACAPARHPRADAAGAAGDAPVTA